LIDPHAAALLAQDWSGTPSALYNELTAIGGRFAESAHWPKSSTRFSIELRRMAPQLAIHGIIVNFSRSHQGRIVSVRRIRSVIRETCDTP